MVNLSAFIRFHALRMPDRTALIYEGQEISFADFLGRIEKTARFLAAHGIGEGDIVAVFMKNSVAFLEIAFATSHLGAIFLPINFRLSAEECAFIANHAEAKLVLADQEFADAVGDLPHTILLGAQAQRDMRSLFLDNMPAAPMMVRKPQDLFRLMYTSGTTDRPKGVTHTYENFYWKCMDHVIALELTRQDRLLAIGPLYHVGAFDLPGMAVLWVGGSIVIHRQFDEEAVLAAIEAVKITCAWFAPMIVGRVLTFSGKEKHDLSSFKWCIAGGEKTPEGRIREFTSLFRNCRFIDAFGLTETCSGDTLMESGMEITKIGSTGRATPHVEIEVRDENGNTLPPGQEGEICIRGPKVTKGYWKDPEKTAQSFFEDWFRSGDIGFLDTDGFLTITDRKKDMIISGGENIASSEVERVIYEIPSVAECAVIGVPDAKWGERPVAIVVLKAGASLTSSAVIEVCRDKLARFKVPRDVFFRDALPRNPSGKVLKRTLRADLAGRLT
jgi:acyl-CoA synthetase (AMP-forming)/AMP-acid ligase II